MVNLNSGGKLNKLGAIPPGLMLWEMGNWRMGNWRMYDIYVGLASLGIMVDFNANADVGCLRHCRRGR